ncbi:MAG: hypothetical protein ACPGWS_08435 [Solirubrobacterales bacterium]
MVDIQPPSLPDLITIDPDPPVAGQKVKVCYDFPSGVTEVKLEIEWSPTGETETLTIAADDNCGKIEVPAWATGMLIVDTSGASADFGTSTGEP